MKRSAWMVLAALFAGCGGGEEPDPGSNGGPDLLQGIVTEKASPDATSIMEEMKADRAEAEVTVVGKVGHMMAGFAAFRLVDLQFQD